MNKKGFTLVEVIAAVALMAILIGLAGTNLIKKYNESKREAIIIQEEQLVQSGDMVVQDYCKDPLSEGYQLQCDNYYQPYEDSNNSLIIEDNTYTKYICVKDLKKLGYYSEELRYSGVDCSGVVIYKIDYDTDLQKDSYSVIKCGEDYVTEVENVNDYLTNFKECFETQNTGQPEEEKKYLLTVNFTELTPNGMKVGTSHSKEYKKGQSISVDVPEYKTFENEYTPFKHGSSQNDNNFSLNADRTKLTGTMPEGNAIINIVYSASTYVLTVNYKEFNDVQGNINFPSKQYTMYYGEEVEIPHENVANFKIISPNNFTYQMQQKDDKVDVIYQQIDFNLTYNSNGGTACNSRKVTYNKAYGALCNPTRTGYTFDGWYLNGSKVTSTTVNTNYNNVTLTAKWNANKYVVTYYMGNGDSTYGSTVLGTSECTYNENCTLKSFASFGTPFPYSDYDPNNDGNVDYGWGYSGWTNFEDTLDIRYADELTFLYDKAYNVGLFAIGKRTLKIYGGVAPSEPYARLEQYWNPIQNSTDYLTSVTFPEAKSISGWTFIGYRDGRSIITDSEGNKTYGISEKNKINSKLPTTTASATITPSVKTNGNIRSIYQRTLTLNYNGNSGTGSVANQTGVQYYNPGIGKNSKYTVPLLTTVSFKLSSNTFTKTGYTFKGWLIGSPSGTLVSAGSTFDFNPALTETPSKTLYAQWEANKYSVVYNCNGGTPTNAYTSSHTYGITAPLANNECSKSGYIYNGWNTAANGTGTAYTNKQNVSNLTSANNDTVTLYAQWNPEPKNTITYIANGTGATLTDGQTQLTYLKKESETHTIKTPTELNASKGGQWTWVQWNTKSDGTGKTYLGTDTYNTNSDLTLYAIWKPVANVALGTPAFVNMAETSIIQGSDSYNFTIKCKTQVGADGIAIPLSGLIPGYGYRVTFTVTFNEFQFYPEDNQSYIFGTNIIEEYKNYSTDYSIIWQNGKTVTHKYENMQWSTESSGKYNVSLDFVASKETMYWFWETSDVFDFTLMTYQFNNFNIQLLKETEYGPRIAFEDLTVKFAEAPYINRLNAGQSGLTAATLAINTTTNDYGTRWPDYLSGTTELTARDKNYFHTESYNFDHLKYRFWGYEGHEVITIPIEKLTVGKTYTISFKQDLTNAIVYNTNPSSLNNVSLYGCAVTATKEMDADYKTTNSVNYQAGYKDLRKAKVGAVSTQSITFTATAETMYWQWLMGDIVDGKRHDLTGSRYSYITLSEVSLTQN